MKRVTSVGAALAMLLLAARALGSPPIPAPVFLSGIQLAGHAAGVADSRAELRIQIVSMYYRQPIPNSTVQILFTTCTGNDLHIADTQSFPGMLWDCGSQTATAVSDLNGVATFRLLGNASAGPGNPPGLTSGCALVRADGFAVSVPVRVSAYDLDGKNGVNAADQSLFMATLFASPAGYRTRADYNGDGLCNSADLAKFLDVLTGGGSSASATPVCF